jgi:hypothetical protein
MTVSFRYGSSISSTVSPACLCRGFFYSGKLFMALSIRERNEMVRQGTKAALIGAGAFTCPYIDDDHRFAAWVEGYELGELRLAALQRRKDAMREEIGRRG